MTNSPPTSISLAQMKWDLDNDAFLSDFVERFPLPHMALITKGQYLTLGVPSLNMPHLKPYLYVHSSKRIRKLVGRLVKSTGKEGKGVVLGEQKICIPEYFAGYFEILSEDGRRIKCIESVSELTEQFPDRCLVRQQCKAYVPDMDGELRSLYKSRTLEIGEVLTLVGRFNFKKTTFLRLFDESGCSVYLKMSQKVKFSSLATRRDSIAGVHNVHNLMTKRLPITVRLINGETSPDLHKLAANLTVRLQHLYVEDVAFVYSMHKPDGQFLAIPLNAHLKLAPVCNYHKLIDRLDFQDMYASCDNAAVSYFDRITSFHNDYYSQNSIKLENSNFNNSLSSNSINQHHNGNNTNNNSINKNHNYTNEYYNGNSMDKYNDMHVTHIEVDPSADLMETTGQDEAVVCNDEEIDQLYDYIRGLAPLPASILDTPRDSREMTNGHRRRRRRPKPNSPPPPPPVETIPGRLSAINSNSLQSTIPLAPNGRTSHHRPVISSPKRLMQNVQHSAHVSAHQPIYESTNVMNAASKLKYHSSTSTSPSNTNTSGPNAVGNGGSAEKRLDGILYGSRGALNGLDSSNYDQLCNTNNSNNTNSNHKRNLVHLKHASAHGQSNGSNRRRPLSMVIPDRVPLFDKNAIVSTNNLSATTVRAAPVPVQVQDYAHHHRYPQQASSGRAAALRAKHSGEESPYHQQSHAYRSHMNLNFMDDHEPHYGNNVVNNNNANTTTTCRSRSPPGAPQTKVSAVPHYQKFSAYPRYSSQYVLNSNGHRI